MPGGPIFIIGAMGSGTTLLRLMLDSHPNIAIPYETGFMRAYNAHQFIPFKWSGRNMARLYPDAVFVGVVRHPAGEVASCMSRFGHSLGRATYHYLRYTKEVARQ